MFLNGSGKAEIFEKVYGINIKSGSAFVKISTRFDKLLRDKLLRIEKGYLEQ